MNVVPRAKQKSQPQPKNALVRKDWYQGISGANAFLPGKYFRPNAGAPRYQFKNEETTSKNKRSAMGPPLELPLGLKRKLVTSSSLKPESSSSGRATTGRVSDSVVAENSRELSTPRNRPNVFTYISGSSKAHSGQQRSARSTNSSFVEPSVILAISEGRGQARGEIGMAAIDLKHPHLVLCQFSDSLLYTHALTKINYFNPVEIIVPHTFIENVQQTKLYQMIKEQCPNIALTGVQRRTFNDDKGRQQIQTLCAPQYSSVYIEVIQKFYALTAAAAVIQYVEHVQCVVFAKQSLKVEYHSSENTMIIDVSTATQLELVQPLVPSAGPSCCLLGILGPTYTAGGLRALRAALLQPSFKKDYIEARLDAVQDIINTDGLMVALQDAIKKITDVDRTLQLCMDSSNQNIDKAGEAQMNQTLLLKTTMEMVPKLIEALIVAESGTLRKIKMDFENPHYEDILKSIRKVLMDDAHMEKGTMGSMQRCFAIKPQINGLLDVARRTYSELVDDIQKLVEDLSNTYDLPLRPHQNVMKGFHITMPLAPKARKNFNVEDLPPVFIHVQNNTCNVSMTTEELVVLDHQLKDALSEVQMLNNTIITSLLKDLRPFMSSLYKLCENVAELDVLLALAQVSITGSYVRPEFGDYLELHNSVHPLLDYNTQVTAVFNNVRASPEYNFTIVTGPNMGGKSVYIKQIAVIQIMAQVGCFVPATRATLRLSDRIFSRIGFNDSVELNASTYVLEMKEINHILKGLTKNSLVIIDELCRGTTSEEGASVAWAVCEELLASDAFTFFTTHFMNLTKLQDLYHNVVNLHTAVTEEVIPDSDGLKCLKYEHKIEQGVTQVENYGLALALRTNMPTETVHFAEDLAKIIKRNIKPKTFGNMEEIEDRLLYKLNADIRREERRKTRDSDEIIRQIITKFKESYPELIRKLRNERQNTTEDTTITSKKSSKSDGVHKSTTLVSNTNSDVIMGANNNINKKSVVVNTSDETFMDVEHALPQFKSSNELLNTMIGNDFIETLNNVSTTGTKEPIKEKNIYMEEKIENLIFGNNNSPHFTNEIVNKSRFSDKEDIGNLESEEFDYEWDDTKLLGYNVNNTTIKLKGSTVSDDGLSLTSDDIQSMQETEETNKEIEDLNGSPVSDDRLSLTSDDIQSMQETEETNKEIEDLNGSPVSDDRLSLTSDDVQSMQETEETNKEIEDLNGSPVSDDRLSLTSDDIQSMQETEETNKEIEDLNGSPVSDDRLSLTSDDIQSMQETEETNKEIEDLNGSPVSDDRFSFTSYDIQFMHQICEEINKEKEDLNGSPVSDDRLSLTSDDVQSMQETEETNKEIEDLNGSPVSDDRLSLTSDNIQSMQETEETNKEVGKLNGSPVSDDGLSFTLNDIQFMHQICEEISKEEDLNEPNNCIHACKCNSTTQILDAIDPNIILTPPLEFRDSNNFF